MTSLKVLFIEDSPEDAELAVREIKRSGREVTWQRVESEIELDSALAHPWDLVLCDFSMPQFDGLSAFRMVKGRGLAAPFIFVSGVLGEERAVEAMRAGARDYVLKTNLRRLGAVVERELAEARTRQLHAAAQKNFERERARAETIFNTATVGLLELDFETASDLIQAVVRSGQGRFDLQVVARAAEKVEIVAANKALAGILDAADEESIAGPVARWLRPGTLSAWKDALRSFADPGTTVIRQAEIESLTGRRKHVLMSFRVPWPVEDWSRVVVSVVDVTERVGLEDQMRAAQRMEAVGRLAGGIAHDFNNVLTVINSYTGFMLRSLPESDPVREDAEVVAGAASRAAGLTRQLLSFSRRQVSELRRVNVNQVMQDVQKMLRHLVGEDIVMCVLPGQELHEVEVDPSHLEQVLMNLAVNGRDALPEGGQLVMETANIHLDEQAASEMGLPAGNYVMLAVTDDGCGMNEETQRKIFEPFFTTKLVGRGTGLGLSTVHGIVKQARGAVAVTSEEGRGSTFKVFLPAAPAGEGLQHSVHPPPGTREMPGGETIMVVEDEAAVRLAAERILREAGYRPILARHGKEALEIHDSHEGFIHLTVTDVVMPELSGQALARQLRSTRPGHKVVYMSGFPAESATEQGIIGSGVTFIQKPFSASSFLSKIREALDAG